MDEYGMLSPSRRVASPPIPQRTRNPPISPWLARAIQLTANINKFATSMTAVTGASCPPSSPSNVLDNFLLAAAREKVRLAPHSWHRVALIPTSVPQAGQSFGRGPSFPPLENPVARFHR